MNITDTRLNSIEGKLSALTIISNLGAAAIGAAVTGLLGGIAAILKGGFGEYIQQRM